MFKESKMQVERPLPKCKIIQDDLKVFVKDDTLFGVCYAIQIPDEESCKLLEGLMSFINDSIKQFRNSK